MSLSSHVALARLPSKNRSSENGLTQTWVKVHGITVTWTVDFSSDESMSTVLRKAFNTKELPISPY